MYLSNVTRNISEIEIDSSSDMSRIPISGISCDSRIIQSGYIFAALKGAAFDGSTFIEKAIDSRASAILTSYLRSDLEKIYSIPRSAAIITCHNPRRIYALMCANFYNAQPQNIVGITGTNGKTSTAYFYQAIQNKLNIASASLGTIGLRSANKQAINSLKYDASLTTPEQNQLHSLLAQMKECNINALALEASSHGLDQNRLDGVRFTAAAFTNLSHEHLDYHKNMDSYFNAKARLFSEILPDNSYAILNADTSQYESLHAICKKKNHKIISYGKAADFIKIIDYFQKDGMQHINFSIKGKEFYICNNLIGDFQTYNVLCALALSIATNNNLNSLEEIVNASNNLESPPGRMEKICEYKDASIIIDYAHDPGALENILNSIAKENKNIILILGCGGDRDKEKRAIMGKVADKRANFTIITDDNPRSENPKKIRSDIILGFKSNNFIEIEDRKSAIERGINMIKDEKDILIIAGKGHEETQKVGNRIIKFSDKEVVKEILDSL